MWPALKDTFERFKAFGHRRRRPILFLAFAGFLAGLVFAGGELTLRLDDLVLLPLIGAIFLTQPVLIFLNSLEFKLCGKAANAHISLRDSLYVSSSATLANILPLPAGLILRGGALIQRGGTLGFVSKVLLVAAMMWVAVALTVSGAVISGGLPARLISLIGGLSICFLLGYISRVSRPGIAFGFLLVRSLMVAILVLQLNLCFAALGEIVPLRNSAVYVVSGIAGAVVSIVPAGLGLTEAFGALLAKIDGASAAMAYVVLSLNRFIGLSMAGLTFFLFSNGGSGFAKTSKS